MSTVDSPSQDRRSRPGATTRGISALALGMTHWIVALVAVFAVLAVSFVSSLGVYLDQQSQIAEVKAEIADHESEISRLEDEFARWQDPAYVRAQARDKLGWVLPGEVGYRVIDAEGQVIGGTVGTLGTAEVSVPPIWYEQLWSSLITADQPPPAEPTTPLPTAPATVGPDVAESPR